MSYRYREESAKSWRRALANRMPWSHFPMPSNDVSMIFHQFRLKPGKVEQVLVTARWIPLVLVSGLLQTYKLVFSAVSPHLPQLHSSTHTTIHNYIPLHIKSIFLGSALSI